MEEEEFRKKYKTYCFIPEDFSKVRREYAKLLECVRLWCYEKEVARKK